MILTVGKMKFALIQYVLIINKALVLKLALLASHVLMLSASKIFFKITIAMITQIAKIFSIVKMGNAPRRDSTM